MLTYFLLVNYTRYCRYTYIDALSLSRRKPALFLRVLKECEKSRQYEISNDNHRYVSLQEIHNGVAGNVLDTVTETQTFSMTKP